MMCAIELYYEFCFVTVKICNIIIYDALLVYLYRIMLQEVIPQMLFLRCHIATQFSCVSQQVVVLFYFYFIHLNVFLEMTLSGDCVATSPRGEAKAEVVRCAGVSRL